MIRSRPSQLATALATGLLALTVALLVGSAEAHVPLFPDDDGPFEVDAPTVSKAYYLRLEAGSSHVFIVPPLSRAVPLQVLVIDDAVGARLAHEIEIACEGPDASFTTETLDLAYFEPFSHVAHRVRIRGTLGPTSGPCTVRIRQTDGPPGPYTFVIGDEERFSASDLLGLFGLGRRLDAWRDGPDR